MKKAILFFAIMSFVALQATTSCNNKREDDSSYTAADSATYMDSVAKAKGDSTGK